MTGVTSSQTALIEHLVSASKDRTIDVVAYFDGMPNGYRAVNVVETEGVLEFETVNDRTVRVRSDTIIGLIEELK